MSRPYRDALSDRRWKQIRDDYADEDDATEHEQVFGDDAAEDEERDLELAADRLLQAAEAPAEAPDPGPAEPKADRRRQTVPFRRVASELSRQDKERYLAAVETELAGVRCAVFFEQIAAITGKPSRYLELERRKIELEGLQRRMTAELQAPATARGSDDEQLRVAILTYRKTHGAKGQWLEAFVATEGVRHMLPTEALPAFKARVKRLAACLRAKQARLRT